MDVEGAFIAIGHKPNTKFLGGQIECDKNGYIKVIEGEMTKTSVEGMLSSMWTYFFFIFFHNSHYFAQVCLHVVM